MSPLPPVDRERNQELIAERCGWPDGALDACRELEKAYPAWLVFWTNGGLPATPSPGYRAVLRAHNLSADLYTSTADEMRAQLAAVDTELPRPSWPPKD